MTETVKYVDTDQLYQLVFPTNYVVGIIVRDNSVFEAAPFLRKLGFLGKPMYWVEAFCKSRNIKLNLVEETNE